MSHYFSLTNIIGSNFIFSGKSNVVFKNIQRIRALVVVIQHYNVNITATYSLV